MSNAEQILVFKERVEEARKELQKINPDFDATMELHRKFTEYVDLFGKYDSLPAEKKSHVLVNGKSFYMDGYMKSNYDHLKRSVRKAWDGVLLVDGMEGSAKTTFSSAGCYYCSDGKFTLKDVFFTPEQFEEWVNQAPPGSAGLWDEFVLGGLSEEALSKMQVAIIKKMTLIRKKRLFIFLVIPYMFMLRPYFAVARTRALIHVYSPDGENRGYFKFYDYRQKRELYFQGKKNWSYNVPFSFKGRFTNYEGMFWDVDAYDTMKEEATQNISSKDSTERWKQKTLSAVSHLWNIVREDHPEMITQKNLCEWFDVSERQLRRWIAGQTG